MNQFCTPSGWPICLHLGGPHGFAYLHLPGDQWIQWNLKPEREERVSWSYGLLSIVRPETPDEEEERLNNESEAAWEERELNRYVEWYY